MLAIWQVACHSTVLVMDAVESWNGFDVQPRESCNVFRVLSLSMMLIQACNINLTMIIYFDHYMACQNHKLLSSKVKIAVAASVGIIGSITTWWYSCGSQEVLSRMAVRLMCVISVIFPVFLSSSTSRDNIDKASQGITTVEASIKTSSLLLRLFIDENKLISFIAMLFMAFILIFTDLAHLSLHFKETFCLLITRFVVGFILPLIVIDMIDSWREEENGRKVVSI